MGGYQKGKTYASVANLHFNISKAHKKSQMTIQ